MKAPCGRTKSRSRKKFNAQSLAHHIQDCLDCRNKRIGGFSVDDDDIDLELADLIAGEDMPNGAYFALAHELGEL